MHARHAFLPGILPHLIQFSSRSGARCPCYIERSRVSTRCEAIRKRNSFAAAAAASADAQVVVAATKGCVLAQLSSTYTMEAVSNFWGKLRLQVVARAGSCSVLQRLAAWSAGMCRVSRFPEGELFDFVKLGRSQDEPGGPRTARLNCSRARILASGSTIPAAHCSRVSLRSVCEAFGPRQN